MNSHDLIDVLVLMAPPLAWWPCGVAGYPGDKNGIFASKTGVLPNSSLVAKEFYALISLLKRYKIPHIILGFPEAFSSTALPPKGAYDAVFIRDSIIVSPEGTAYVPARFRDKQRQVEVPFIMAAFDILGLKRACEIKDVPASVEGGDTICGFLPTGEKYLFTGTQRNTKKGSSFLRAVFGIKKESHVNIRSSLCHIDSLMCSVETFSGLGRTLNSIIICSELISSGYKKLNKIISASTAKRPIFTSIKDSSENDGSLAINGISIKSSFGHFLITGSRFQDQTKVEDSLHELGFVHVFSPLTQYLYFSSGGIRCSTQIIRTSLSLLKKLQTSASQPETGVLHIWLP